MAKPFHHGNPAVQTTASEVRMCGNRRTSKERLEVTLKWSGMTEGMLTSINANLEHILDFLFCVRNYGLHRSIVFFVIRALLVRKADAFSATRCELAEKMKTCRTGRQAFTDDGEGTPAS